MPRRWTSEQDALLKKKWGRESAHELARLLERTPLAVVQRGEQLGLRACRPGTEPLTVAAERVGMSTVALKKILPLLPVMTRQATSRRVAVESSMVARAVAERMRRAPVAYYAALAGMDKGKLRRWCVMACQFSTLALPPRPPKSHQWLLTDAEVEAVISWHASLITVADLAARSGLPVKKILSAIREHKIRTPRERVKRLLTPSQAELVLSLL